MCLTSKPMKRSFQAEIIFSLSLNVIYLAASSIYYLIRGDTLFGTPHQVLWVPFVIGFYAGHVIFNHLRLTYCHAFYASLIYSITVTMVGALVWIVYAFIASGFSLAIFNFFSLLPIVMMAIDAVRNLIFTIPALMIFVWLTRKLTNYSARTRNNNR